MNKQFSSSAALLLLQVIVGALAYALLKPVFVVEGTAREFAASLIVPFLLAGVSAGLVALWGMMQSRVGRYLSDKERGAMLFRVGIAHFAISLTIIPIVYMAHTGFHVAPFAIAVLFALTSATAWRARA